MTSYTLRNRIVAAIESGGDSSSLELDSHADSPVVGSKALIIRAHDRKVRVNGFTPALGSNTVDVVEAAIAYGCEFTGKVLIIIIRNGLHLKELKHNLLSPFITRLSGIELNEHPSSSHETQRPITIWSISNRTTLDSHLQ